VALLVHDDLLAWQKLNVAAFLSPPTPSLNYAPRRHGGGEQELPLMLGDILVEEIHPATSVGS